MSDPPPDPPPGRCWVVKQHSGVAWIENPEMTVMKRHGPVLSETCTVLALAQTHTPKPRLPLFGNIRNPQVSSHSDVVGNIWVRMGDKPLSVAHPPPGGALTKSKTKL